MRELIPNPVGKDGSMLDDPPMVSVVIPTFQRPALLERAVQSVLQQSHPVAEIIVVIDGEARDQDTLACLSALDDRRIVPIEARRQLGNAEARNLGIQNTSGDWVALLDDDDWWYPNKLASQIESLRTREHPAGTIMSCRLIAVAGGSEFRWPRLLPGEREAMGDYLFCRRWPMTGDRLAQTSTLLASRELFLAVPFRSSRRFVDQDWLLRCAGQCDARLLFPDTTEPLVVWDLGQGRARVSDYKNWRWCLDWIGERRNLTSPRARAGFLLSLASASAADAGEYEAFLPLLRAAFRLGRPNLAGLLSHALNFCLSRAMRDALVRRISRRQRR